MSETSRLVTAEELEKFPDDDYRYELVEGRVIRMSPVGYLHGRTVVRFCGVLDRHVRARTLGAVVTEVGFKLRSNPDTVRTPDIAFIRQERLPGTDPQGFWQGAPDLAVEVLSPEDRPAEVRAKVDEYLVHGVPAVVVIDRANETATVFRQSTSPLRLEPDAILDLTDIVQDFRCALRELFE
jgi:Uma2 family endonuclease